MRIERAIDAFLNWRRLERDATPSSVESYRRILWKLTDEYPEVEIDFLTTEDLRRFLNRWLERSAATRSNVISVLHSFFAWAEGEDLIMSIRPARSAGRRSGSPTSTGPALTNWLRSEPPRWGTSVHRSC